MRKASSDKQPLAVWKVCAVIALQHPQALTFHAAMTNSLSHMQRVLFFGRYRAITLP